MPVRPHRILAVLSVLLLGLSSALAKAQGYAADKPVGTTAQQLPGYLAHAGVEQRLGETLPLSALFSDESGRTAPLKTWFTGRPVVLALVYYRCMMLCPQVLHSLAEGLRDSTLKPGKEYEVLVFSIDPADTAQDAASQKQQFLRDAGMGPAGSGAVHFLTASQASIDAIAGATGFHYVKVPGPDGKMDQYAHSSVIMFATPGGRLSKYIAGLNYVPRDLRLALLDASERRISNPVDLLILYCCSYNPVVGGYTVSVMRVLSLAGMVAIIAVILMLILLSRKPRPHPAG